MHFEHPIRTEITFETFPDCDPPKYGDQYLDPRGQKWTVRGVKPARAWVLRNPPPPFEGFQVTIEPEWAMATIKSGEELIPIKGVRCSGSGWSGRVQRHTSPAQGFGEVTKNGVTYSWLLRVRDNKAVLRIGPQVDEYQESYFAGGVYETENDTLPADLVGFVRESLEYWIAAD